VGTRSRTCARSLGSCTNRSRVGGVVAGRELRRLTRRKGASPHRCRRTAVPAPGTRRTRCHGTGRDRAAVLSRTSPRRRRAEALRDLGPARQVAESLPLRRSARGADAPDTHVRTSGDRGPGPRMPFPVIQHLPPLAGRPSARHHRARRPCCSFGLRRVSILKARPQSTRRKTAKKTNTPPLNDTKSTTSHVDDHVEGPITQLAQVPHRPVAARPGWTGAGAYERAKTLALDPVPTSFARHGLDHLPADLDAADLQSLQASSRRLRVKIGCALPRRYPGPPLPPVVVTVVEPPARPDGGRRLAPPGLPEFLRTGTPPPEAPSCHCEAARTYWSPDSPDVRTGSTQVGAPSKPKRSRSSVISAIGPTSSPHRTIGSRQYGVETAGGTPSAAHRPRRCGALWPTYEGGLGRPAAASRQFSALLSRRTQVVEAQDLVRGRVRETSPAVTRQRVSPSIRGKHVRT